MSGEDCINPPSVIWAQRAGTVLITICLEDCNNPQVDIKADCVSFRGIGGSEKKPHEVNINLYKEIDPDKSKVVPRPRYIEIILNKKEEGPFWPHLTKEKIKCHWLKIDFNKWRDEDDSEDEGFGGGNDDLEEMMKQMGGLAGSGGELEKPNFDDLNETDSDDGDLPDLE